MPKRATDSDSYVLAIDLGTSSTKSAFFSLEGKRILESTVHRAYPIATDATGLAELQAHALADAFDACLAGSIEAMRNIHAGKIFRIEAVGVSCFWHSLMGLDAKGKALTEVITWADSRCKQDAADLRKELSEKKVHAATGCMLRSSFWPSKLAWLRRTNRGLWDNVSRWVSPAEWLVERWTGQGFVATGMATGTGLFEPGALKWNQPLLDRLEIDPKQLNPIHDEPMPVPHRKIVHLPELEGAKWFPAIGDGAASNLGCGATAPGLAALNLGTSAALRVMRTGVGKQAKAPFGLFCYRVDRERFLLGGAISNAGNLRAWCLRELRLNEDPDELETLLQQRPEPRHGLTVLPFWMAERAPYWREEMPSFVMGMTAGTSALDLLQATTEAVYFRLALIASKVRQATNETPKILVSGGAQKSPASMQRLADILNQPVYPSDEPEASLRGAAVYVLEKLGAKLAQMRFHSAVRPRPKIAKSYERELEKHSAFEEAATELL